ncbi:MAG: acyl-CoA dehydrogenase family protein [Proteobacteria bacterium]|nr:acyl-CoA dehydrogenase family protein [Pseudomonadota bacterium]
MTQTTAAPTLSAMIRDALTAPVEVVDALAPWLHATEATFGDATPLARAVAGAARSDRMAGVFAVAYRAALADLLPGFSAAALCVTEAKGNHPRSIETSATGGEVVHLQGTKHWSTLADRAETLLVAANEGMRDGRPVIGVYAVPANAEGVTLKPMPPTPFVPEVPHFQVHIDTRVPRSSRVPGDGWADIIKPFRTVEDLFVTAALCGFGLRQTRDPAWAAVLAGLWALSHASPRDPAVHLVLDGLMSQAHALILPVAETDERLSRDLKLLKVAGTARRARLARAKSALGIAEEN